MEDNSQAPKQHDSITALLKDIATPTVEQQPQQAVPPQLDAIDEEKKQATASMANTTENKDAAAVPVKKVDEKLLGYGAEAVVATFDFTQDNLFTFLGKIKRKKKLRKLYGEEWDVKLNDAKSKIDLLNANKSNTGGEVIELITKEDVGLIRLEAEFDSYFDDLSLTEKEKDQLKIPLMEIMRIKGGTIPPEYLLMLTLLQIFGARGTELATL